MCAKANLSTAFLPDFVNKLQLKLQCGLREATKKWSMPIRNWGIILNQFLTLYEKRVRI